MRHALRRILWIVPMMLAVSLAAFWALSQGAPPTRPEDALPTRVRDDSPVGRLPLFFNHSPRSVKSLARQAVDSIARQDERAAASARLLVRLGGAALPHVLPRLDSLAPTERARVALSLAPLGRRMKVGSDEELTSGQSAVLFWHRFWEDRAIDFRPAVVKRSVRRLAKRARASRREDIMQLDTFALPELIDAMGTVNEPEAVLRAQRLTHLAAHVTGIDWRISDAASVQEAHATVARWKRWWRLNEADYVEFDGPRRLSAMVVETSYGKWATEAAQGDLGTTAAGRPVLEVMKQRAPVTLWLIITALLGGYGAGVALGLLAGARSGRPLDWVSSVGAVALAAVPVATLAALLAPTEVRGSPWLAALIMASVVAALVSRYQRAAARGAVQHDYCRTLSALGASPWTAATRSLKNSGSAVASLLGVHLPAVITTAFVVEHAFRLGGLAEVTLVAVRERDVAWLMALALSTVLVVALAQAGSDTLLAALDPRVRAALARRRGSRE